jgi:hypothetical protein
MFEQQEGTSTLNIKLGREVLSAVERAAAEDRRSITSFIERLLSEHLYTKGYLRRPGDEGLRPEELTSENDG